MAWEPRQAKEFARQLRREVGDGWRYMTEDTRRAYAARATLTVVRMQVRPVQPADIDHLLAGIERALDLDD